MTAGDVTKKRVLWLGIAISVSLAAFVLRKTDLRESWTTLRMIRPQWLVLPLVITLVSYPLRALRWKVIFPPEPAPGFLRCLQVLSIGVAANNFLPGRAGDLARCSLLSRKFSLSAASLSLGTLAVEKLADGLMLIAVVVVSLHAASVPLWISRMLWISAILFGSAAAVFVAMHHRPQSLVDAVSAGSRVLGRGPISERVEQLIRSFVQGLSAVRSGRQVGWIVALTLLVWTGEGGLIWSLALALQLKLSISGAFLAAALLGLGLMIPAAPGAVGSYEFFSVAGLRLVGIEASKALTLSVLLHAWVFLAGSAVGLCCLWGAGMNLAQLRRMGEATEA